jgi:hypothetical protein
MAEQTASSRRFAPAVPSPRAAATVSCRRRATSQRRRRRRLLLQPPARPCAESRRAASSSSRPLVPTPGAAAPPSPPRASKRGGRRARDWGRVSPGRPFYTGTVKTNGRPRFNLKHDPTAVFWYNRGPTCQAQVGVQVG